MFVDRSNAGRAFKRLEQAGYVVQAQGRGRQPDQPHRHHRAGPDAAAEIKRPGYDMARTFFGDLTEADAATIVQLLREAL